MREARDANEPADERLNLFRVPYKEPPLAQPAWKAPPAEIVAAMTADTPPFKAPPPDLLPPLATGRPIPMKASPLPYKAPPPVLFVADGGHICTAVPPPVPQTVRGALPDR